MTGLRRLRRDAGMTVVELGVAIGIGAVALGAGVMLSNNSLRDSNSMYVRTSLQVRAAETTDRICKELQSATFVGEDVNENGVLDAGEDVNRNGRLDADWSLANGEIAATLTLNRLRDGWLWSDPVTYTVSNGVLLRTENGVQRDVCRGVTSLVFLRSGNIVDVALTLTGRDRAGQTWTEVSKRRAHVRN